MSVSDPLPHWRSPLDGADDTPARADARTKPWVVSFAAHVLIMIALGLVPRVETAADSRVRIVNRSNQDVPTELFELLVETPIDLKEFDERLPEVGAPSVGLVELAAPPPIGELVNNLNAIDASDALSSDFNQKTLLETYADDGAALTDELTGVRGATVDARGIVGSVERITTEILNQLENDKLLVVWLMDASESLRGRREEIIQHFDRVYTELDVLVDGKDEPLLTSVVAFGQGLVPMMREPTADRQAIEQSVRRIEGDPSGEENVFSAIQATAVASKKFSRGGRRVMIVVVTDERGTDLNVLEDALAMVRRQAISVYVMGPSAAFGKEQIRVRWIDRESGEVHLLPVDRGPETAQVEHAQLAIWRGGPGSRTLRSGFGPFGLTRIAHETGGLYLLQDDGAIGGPAFDVLAMSRYRPDYVTPAQYKRMAAGNPFRMAVLRTAQASNQLIEKTLLRTFLAAGIQFTIRDARRQLSRDQEVFARGLSELDAVRKLRDQETSPRWQAHYDLLAGRLLANQIRCVSYDRLLGEMFANPRVPDDGVKNAWLVVREASKADDKIDSVRANTSEIGRRKDNATLARQYLRRVVNEHPDTPWSVIAEQELKFPLAFRWQAAFIVPPDGVALPWDKVPWAELTDAQKKAKTNFDARRPRQQPRRQNPVAASPPPVRRPPPKL